MRQRPRRHTVGSLGECEPIAWWNKDVHYGLTKRWAEEEGFAPEEAHEIAYWDLWTDRMYPGNRRKTKRYHFPAHGSQANAEDYLGKAVEDRKLAYLGIALHSAQDSVGHGRFGHVLHVPPIDTWDRRSEAVRKRTEEASRRLLRAYRESRGDS